MPLEKDKSYFICTTDAVLRATASEAGGNEMNHLIYGDWVRFLGDEKPGWARVQTRGSREIVYVLKSDTKTVIRSIGNPEEVFALKKNKEIKSLEDWGNIGWLKKNQLAESRPLELNFVDVGQGDGCHLVTPDDEIIIIDSGLDDNMHRFLAWRYNLRWRKVKGIDDVTDATPGAVDPLPIHRCVISHPDQDHYLGFKQVFEDRKLSVEKLYHNGAVERPISAADKEAGLKYYSNGKLGGYLSSEGQIYLWDVVSTAAELKALLKKHKDTSMKYLPVLQAAVDNNKTVKFKALNSNDKFLDGFEEGKDLEIKVLGPVPKRLTRNGKSKDCLLRLGDDGVTKNGHSVIFQVRIGKLKIMLGGDLNTEAEDHLVRHYAGANLDISEVDGHIRELEAKGVSITPDEKTELETLQKEREAAIAKARTVFGVDVSKACHHGSHHFSESFIRILNSAAVIISSGDAESYAHPRPDALGAFGKYSRGVRPLIFSTELARSTREFTPVIKFLETLEKYQAQIAAAPTEAEKNVIRKRMQNEKDRNVAVYGLITLRTDGEKVIIAQKLEQPGGFSKKWDIHELAFNENTGQFEYLTKTGH